MLKFVETSLFLAANSPIDQLDPQLSMAHTGLIVAVIKSVPVKCDMELTRHSVNIVNDILLYLWLGSEYKQIKLLFGSED